MANKSSSNLAKAYQRGRNDAATTGASCPYTPGSAKAREWQDGREYQWHVEDMGYDASRPDAF